MPTERYLENCIHIGNFESENTIYLFNKNPKQNVIGKTKNNEAIWGLKTTVNMSKICLSKINENK